MVPLLASAGLGLVVVPGFTHRWLRRLPPPRQARFCRTALVAGLVVVQVAAVLYAAPVVLGALDVEVAAGACRRLLGPLVPGGEAAGWGAAAAAAALPTLLVLGGRRSRRAQLAARIEPTFGEHRRHGANDLVVIPCDEHVALSVEGRPGQIVVSRGLLAALGPAELDAVVRHEAAHLAHRHQRFLVLSGAIGQALGFLPPVRRSLAVLRTSLERWADEASTGLDIERRSALRRALITATMATGPVPVPALSEADTVMERLAALDRPPSALRWSGLMPLYGSGLLLGLVAATAVVLWTCQAGVLYGLGLCPRA